MKSQTTKKLAIRKGDKVKIIAGSEKGTTGNVLDVDPKRLRVLVQGVRVQTHFDKKEGILKKEGYLDYSNVQLLEKAQPDAKKSKKSKAARK
jgi:large subunit ribosomal protein L24